ncbi:beta-lactamase family protein [Flavobacteriaceae bacterium TP-CH-4]|uniref:Beta-lactamase family protein n=1 Tax=Pelagihabitans pacificus TaxID=2696054 RepID=A0A967APQ9_9FLAO|nr:serine hydrolase domain-containing protein [Pelagihabitans pacificus]NHF58176.1 beta-lactamase family protein [Pelagihabitans pacificus]
MSKYVVLVVAVSIFHFGTAQNNEADSLLRQLVSKKHVVGASAGYSVGGEILWQQAVGYADREADKKFELQTITRPASIAKPMTAIAVMQLVEQGKVDLDAPIQTYIPSYPKQPKTQITPRQLLSHTSGIDGYKNVREAQTTKNYEDLTAAVAVFQDRKLLFEPGTRYSYSTYGYVVLGLLIEKVSGDTYENYMKKNILDKAGMQHTGVEKYGVPVENKSKLYQWGKKGKITEEAPNNLSNRIPAGGFYTTMGDLLKFGHAVLNHTLVSKATLELMGKHHSLEKENNGYGFGWFLYGKKPNEGAILGHSGTQTGSSSQLFIVPSKQAVVVVLANTSRSWQAVIGTAAQLMNLALPKD